jgi:hypothetical protein
MADRQKHIQQWEHNRKLLALLPPEFPDWLVTCAFYVALHSVDALLAFDKVQRVTSHESRNKVLMHTNRYGAVTKAYMPLYGLSRTVRYLADPASWVPLAEIEKNVIHRYLYPIEKSVQGLMGVDLGLLKIKIASTPPQGNSVVTESLPK